MPPLPPPTPSHAACFTIHNSQFTIHNSQFTIHNSQPTFSSLSLITHLLQHPLLSLLLTCNHSLVLDPARTCASKNTTPPCPPKTHTASRHPCCHLLSHNPNGSRATNQNTPNQQQQQSMAGSSSPTNPTPASQINLTSQDCLMTTKSAQQGVTRMEVPVWRSVFCSKSVQATQDPAQICPSMTKTP